MNMDLIHVIALLSIGFLIFTIDKKQENFPVPMVLLLTGIGLSFFAFFSGVRPTETLIHDWFLPAVLFTSAYQFNTKWLKENAWLIGLISTVGLMTGVLLIGSSIYLIGLASLSFTGALLIASILTPIDSVSVFSVQQETDKDKKVEEVVEGESLASDGTSIVVFGTVFSLFLANQEFHLASFIGDFIVKAGGGVIIGVAAGWLFSKALHWIRHHHYQVMLSIILAYASFYIAHHLHLAGLLATISAGLMLSWELNRTDREKEYRGYLDGFWEVAEPAILSLIFLLIGIEFLDHIHWNDFLLIGIVFLLTLLIRFVLVAALTKTVPKLRGRFKWGEMVLITISGIKGTVSVSLLLGIAASQAENTAPILSIAFGVVVLSIIVQSILIYPLSKWIVNR